MTNQLKATLNGKTAILCTGSIEDCERIAIRHEELINDNATLIIEKAGKYGGYSLKELCGSPLAQKSNRMIKVDSYLLTDQCETEALLSMLCSDEE